jgi:hypothetical protein
LAGISSWRLAPAGANPDRRVGDAAVAWTLPGGAGLTGHYRITLQRDDGKVLLAGITPERKETTQ